MKVDNRWVEATLTDFTDVIPPNYFYFVLGSVALLSYTEPLGYTRKIKDIDIIGSNEGFLDVRVGLSNKGYQQDTFIDKKYPLADILRKKGDSKYLRFEQDGKVLEVMGSEIDFTSDSIEVELYPGIAITLPKSSVCSTQLNGQSFRAASPEALYCIYNVGLKTWGRVVKTRIEQRQLDLKALREIINMDKLNEIARNAYLRVGLFRFRIPNKFISSTYGV